jgi:hypothetical protein
MNRLNQIAHRLIAAAAALSITYIVASAVVSIGEPQRSRAIATNMLARQTEIVARGRQPERSAAAAGNEASESVAVPPVVLGDHH